MRQAKKDDTHMQAGKTSASSGRTVKEKRPNPPLYNPIWISNINQEWEVMIPHGQKVTFRPKEHVPAYQEGEKGFYYLRYGKAKVTYTDAHGKEVPVYHLGEGTLMYDIAANSLPESNYNIYAITPLEAYFFSDADYFTEEFTLQNPQLMLNIISSQAHKNIHYMRRLVTIAGGNAFSNTCKLMLDLVRYHGNVCDVPLGITHEEIASLLCVRRSWLGKILRRLKDEKIITRCTKSRLIVSNLDKLTSYALGHDE